MHGDFIAEKESGKNTMIGGLSLLSGYINRVRKEEENVFYVISGDMVQGSLIDSEYKGVSTMEIMNYLAPDVVALGNHEFDYGLPHLLFLEKMANFPIVNANLYIKQYNKRLMRPYIVLQKAGFEILFTGIITEKVMDAIKLDSLVGSFVTLEEARSEVEKITSAYKNDDIDLTILLTHIGMESDKKLASMLPRESGVDIIIGGHSHTYLEKPEKVNNILIVQAGTSTNQVGRFDIVVDDDTNSIVDYQWKLVTIDGDVAEPDAKLEKFICGFQNEVDRKYNTVLSKFTCELTHPSREVETSLGNLFADAAADIAGSDIALIGSGSIRVKTLGPVVTLKEYKSAFPYDDTLTKYTITGKVVKQIFTHILRKENRNGEGECYQVNSALHLSYSDSAKQIITISINGKPIMDTVKYSIALQGYHVKNCVAYLGISDAELLVNEKPKMITTSISQMIEEWFRDHQNIQRAVEGRIVYEA